MHDTILLVAETIRANAFGAYFIIYIATIFFGNISAFVGFWIIFEANFGIFGFLCLILTIFLSDMTGDLLWYSLGRSLRGTRFGLWVETHLPGHARAEAMVQRRGQQWLFLSKFVIGFAPPVVFSIGWSGMDLKTFYKNSLLSILLWLPILIGLAYGIVSGLAPLAATDFRKVEFVFLAGLVLFVILDYAVVSGIGKLAKCLLKTSGPDNNLTDGSKKDYHEI